MLYASLVEGAKRLSEGAEAAIAQLLKIGADQLGWRTAGIGEGLTQSRLEHASAKTRMAQNRRRHCYQHSRSDDLDQPMRGARTADAVDEHKLVDQAGIPQRQVERDGAAE